MMWVMTGIEPPRGPSHPSGPSLSQANCCRQRGRTVSSRRRHGPHRPAENCSKLAAAEAAKRREEEQVADEGRRREQIVEAAEHWQAIDRLRRMPSAEHARIARSAFRLLALRLHPDQGGTHQGFLRLKDAYDRAFAACRFPPSRHPDACPARKPVCNQL